MGFILDRPPRTLYTDTVSDLLYIGGGGFTHINSDYIRGIAYWDGTAYHNMGLGIDLGGTPGNVLAIKRYRGNIYVGGAFTAAGNQYTPNMAKWDGAAWTSIGANGSVTDMEIYNDELFVCGSFDSIAGIEAHNIAKYDGFAWTAVNTPSYMNGLNTLEFFNGNIFAGGIFSDSAGATPQNIAQYNGISWNHVAGDVPGLFASVFQLKVFENELYVMGRFYTSDGNPSTSIMKWNGTGWLNVGNGVGGVNPTISSCSVFNTGLYTAGSFLSAGGIPANKIAKWDGWKWCASSSVFNNNIDAIEIYHHQLIAGGGFTRVDSDTMYYMAKCDIDNFTDTCSISFTGLDEPARNGNFSIYPNPSWNILTIQLSSLSAQATMVILQNTLGQTLQTFSLPPNQQQVQINISDLPPGIYFIRLQTSNYTTCKKFVKE